MATSRAFLSAPMVKSDLSSSKVRTNSTNPNHIKKGPIRAENLIASFDVLKIDYVIIALMYAYTSGIGLQFIGLTIALFGSLAAMCLNYVPMTIMEQLQFSTILIFAASKVPQAWTNFKTKSTGKLALITFLLNFAGSMARIFTTLQEVNDPIGTNGNLKKNALAGLHFWRVETQPV